jgi:hypothetical protein
MPYAESVVGFAVKYARKERPSHGQQSHSASYRHVPCVGPIRMQGGGRRVHRARAEENQPVA